VYIGTLAIDAWVLEFGLFPDLKIMDIPRIKKMYF
jgi:hypothetical protein